MGKILWIEVADRSLIDDRSHFIMNVQDGKNKKIEFDFFHENDTITGIFNELLKDAVSAPIENIDVVRKDMQLLINARRVKKIEYD